MKTLQELNLQCCDNVDLSTLNNFNIEKLHIIACGGITNLDPIKNLSLNFLNIEFSDIYNHDLEFINEKKILYIGHCYNLTNISILKTTSLNELLIHNYNKISDQKYKK